jgi:hypothetical protein
MNAPDSPRKAAHPATEPRAPRVRCYQCGAADIAALCRHCWRPGCEQHVRLPAGRNGWRIREPATAQGPGLAGRPAFYCADCARSRARPRAALAVAGAAITLIGLAVVWLGPLAGLALVLIGLAATGAAITGRPRRVMRRMRTRAGDDSPVSVHPKVSWIRISERLRVETTLRDDGGYQVTRHPVQGELSACLVLGQADRQRVHDRAGRLIMAGHLVLTGRPAIAWTRQVPGPVIPLDTSADPDQFPVFRCHDPATSSPWDIGGRFMLRTEPDLGTAPFWITPSIIPESGRHALELDVQWGELLELEVFESLTVHCPMAWGTVEGISNIEAASTGPGATRTVRWLDVSPAERERQARRLVLTVKFRDTIELNDTLRGTLVATMKGTFSGAEGILLYDALGALRPVPHAIQVRTRIETSFDLSLASLRYQAVRVIPDQLANTAGETMDFAVVPDDETVIALTNAMSAEGYYIKRVVENPPRTGAKPGQVHRYWDIAARKYQGVYPVDVHLVILGEEVRAGQVRPQSGTSRIRISVTGAYTDEDMYHQLKDEWEQIRAVTNKALETR